MSFQTATPSPTSRPWWLALLGPLCTCTRPGVVFRAMCKEHRASGPLSTVQVGVGPCTLVLRRRRMDPIISCILRRVWT